jgi:hypothetical protein
MRLRAMSVLGLFLVTSAGVCDGLTEPPPDTCEEGVTKTLTIGSPTTGAVAGGDCQLPDGDGRRGDSYTFTVTTTSIFSYNVQGQTETGIRIREGNTEIAVHDNGLENYNGYVALKPGTYTLDIAADEEGASGDYSIGSGLPVAPNPQGCAQQPPEHMRFAQLGVTVSGEIKSTDCAGSASNKVDNFNVRMTAGAARKITVTVPATANGVAVEIRRIDSPTLVTTPQARNTAGDIVVNFTPGVTDYFNIAIITTPGTATIAYTVKFE